MDTLKAENSAAKPLKRGGLRVWSTHYLNHQPQRNIMFSALIENHSQSRNTRHVEGVGFLCSTCWQQKPVKGGGGTGYGYDNEGRLHCYECCGKRDREELRDRSKPFFAYVSCDGRSITSWPGAALGSIFEYAEHSTGWHGSTQARFRVRDVHGQWWAGRGPGRGMYCTLRPMKAPR